MLAAWLATSHRFHTSLTMPPAQADAINRQIYAEQVGMLYRLTPQSVAGGAVFACLLAWAISSTAGSALTGGWLAIKLAIHTGRGLDWLAWSHEHDPIGTATRWRWRHGLGSALDGFSWGLSTWLFTPSGEPLLDGALFACLVGVVSIGVFARTSVLVNAQHYLLGTLGPLCSQQLYQGHGSPASLLLGLGLMVYGVVILAECRRAEQRQLEMLRLRFENAAIAEQLREAVLVAEHSNATKGRFLAMVSHELRTPLNGILGMSELMHADVLSQPQRQRLRVMRESAQHLLSLIGDVLDLSRAEFGRLELIPQDVVLRQLVQQVHTLLAPLASERELCFAWECDPHVPPMARLDPVRVKQVLHNLIGNAIKFTPQGWVRLALDFSPEGPSGPLLTFTVSDSGQGIAPEEMSRIFQAFEQGHSLTDVRRSGTGLGLTVARQLAQAMGGDVVYDSTHGPGATFVFTMRWQAPMVSESEMTSTSGLDETSALPAPTPVRSAWPVLVVEDNPVNALVAQGMLEQLGWASEWAQDGEQALASLMQHRYALVLMDCQMPVLDGFETTRRWREHERSGAEASRLPIVALTANALQGDSARCLAAGMDDYLSKPFNSVQLSAVLDRHVLRPTASAAPVGSG